MENIRVNDVLPHEIVKVNNDLTTRQAPNMPTARLLQQVLAELIDELGARSAKEQGLKRIITTSEKLRNSDHTLYLLNDLEANNGCGEAIGLLKVGRKKLFLYDEREQVVEVEPLCVLDFFVSCARQRRGLGRKLFDHMLQDQKVRPEQLAIDGPSTPMSAFLVSHYGFKQLIKQNNNFAVPPQFFDAVKHIRHHGINRQEYREKNPDYQNRDPYSTSPGKVQQAPAAVGRFAAHHRPTQMGKVIHGGSDEIYSKHVAKEATPRKPDAPRREVPATPPNGAVKVHKIELEAASAMAGLTLDVGPEGANGARGRSEGDHVPSHLSPACNDRSRAGSVSGPRRESMMTPDGHMDLKYYHNKIW